MADSSYIYVNGHGDYAGNILLDPEGTVTRAELYDVIAELGHPVELQVPESVQTCLPIGTAALCVIAVFTAVRSFR